MADALLGAVVENLVSLIQNEFSTSSGLKSKAQSLSNTLFLINAVLEDAEQKQFMNTPIKIWLQQLKDAVYVLDDILDECSIEYGRLSGWSSFKPKNIKFRHEIGKKMKEITQRFDQIAESKNKFLLRETVTVREKSIEVVEWRQTSSVIAEPKVYGREDDKEKIVKFLLTEEQSSLSVYPIVGLGGVGKTTLTQLVYNDDRVIRKFNTKIWVCVSENFSIMKILCSIIESITRQKYDALDLDVIQKKVQELLQSNRYLLVLDDVWNKTQQLNFGLSQEKWNTLKSTLACGFKGSSILVSTRDEVVAEIMGTCQAHHLSGLSDNDCWLLFKQYAFGHEKEGQAKLVAIGKEIVKKCGGLPLAAQALGGLMSSRSGEKEWLEIKESRLWNLPHDNSILPALRLSYSHLTSTLKHCFTFCAIFPKDTKIMKDELIHIWMANGSISSRENLEVEDVGNMIWNELYQKSFFQDIKMDDHSNIISFKMHDLIHDLAQSLMGQECMILEDANKNKLSKNTHHISFNSNHLSSFDKGSFKKVESLRTLIQLNGNFHKTSFDFLPTKCSLRILCTSSFQVSSLNNLIHLRYLELHKLDIETLPNSIYNLKKLEILKLKYLKNLSCLPKDLACLQNLRHLVIEDCLKLSRCFPNIRKLTSLKTLSLYIVSLEKGHSLTELHDLNLGGTLKIEGLYNVGSLSETQGANLKSKIDIWKLCLSWRVNYRFNETPNNISAEQVLEGLQPHLNLKSLKIDYYKGLCFPSWITLLRSLVALELRFCRNFVSLSPIGKLPSLKKLYLFNLDEVKFMDDDDDSDDGKEVRVFPSLEELRLSFLPKLERLSKVEKGEMFPCLSSLNINECPKLELQCFPSLKELYVCPCSNELLQSISNLHALTTLDLSSDYGITSFPEGMFTNLTSLQYLTVMSFPELESLPENISEGATSLRTMNIYNCKGLKSLPEGIRHLTSLEILLIDGCPTLEERCKEGTGEDWNKISHIPKLRIGMKK